MTGEATEAPAAGTGRLGDALAYALQVHQGQVRKGTNIPYFSHLLGVCSLVMEDWGDETEAIAALLHDAAEDQGGRERLDDIRRWFGDRVADIVEACTDTLEDPKPHGASARRPTSPTCGSPGTRARSGSRWRTSSTTPEPS